MLSLLFLGSAEAGHLPARSRAGKIDDRDLSEISTIQAAVLGLVALLRTCADTRFDLQRAGADPARLRAAHASTGDVQNRLWAEARAAAERDPRSVPIGLFIASLNDMIDMQSRVEAREAMTRSPD